jgi:hypothetical protein
MEQLYQSPQASLPVRSIGRIVCAVEDPAKDKYKLTAYNGDREHRSASYVHHSEHEHAERGTLFKTVVEVLVYDLPQDAFKVEPACERAHKEVAAHITGSVELKTLEGKIVRLSA